VRVVRVARDALEAIGFVEHRRSVLVRAQVEPRVYAAGIRNKPVDEGSADSGAPFSRSHIQPAHAADRGVAGVRVAIHAADAAHALASLRDVDPLARLGETVAPVAPFANEPRHHALAVGIGVDLELTQLLEVAQRFDDEIGWHAPPRSSATAPGSRRRS
jgi:hypothetical protein